jgi:hypothetical protein
MMQSHKQNAAIHLGFAAGGGTSIPFETNQEAEIVFNRVAEFKEKNHPIIEIHHADGVFCAEVSFIRSWAWTREKRINVPIMGGQAGLMSMGRN